MNMNNEVDAADDPRTGPGLDSVTDADIDVDGLGPDFDNETDPLSDDADDSEIEGEDINADEQDEG